MATALDGDYSKYPKEIREAFSYLAGETCMLRQSWEVYKRLFMEDQRLTKIMAKGLGQLLGLFQTNLQDGMLLSIARLTDADGWEKNLSIARLQDATSGASNAGFRAKVEQAITDINFAAKKIRKHRNKRIAHSDLKVSLKAVPLAKVTLAEIREVIEMFENVLNLFFWEFERMTTRFDLMQNRQVTNAAEVSVLKALAYDILESEGRIPHNEWRKQLGAIQG
jgi:AbiU2